MCPDNSQLSKDAEMDISRKKEAVRPWPWCGNEACAFEKQKENKYGWSIMREGQVGLRRSERFTPSLNYLPTAMERH